MSIIREHTSATLSDAWRTVDIDRLEEESSVNFDTSTLRPPQTETSESEVRQRSQQVRQLFRGGDPEGALRGCLEAPVYQGPDLAKEAHLQTVLDVLQSIRASEMTPMLTRIYESQGGGELLDVLMKYIYKGMAASASNAAGSGHRSPAKVTPQATGFSQMMGRSSTSNEAGTTGMSVLLSWHEKVVEIAGKGCIVRTMTDWRKV